MCDVYTAECSGKCSAKIEMHIADFCTTRDKVHPYCPTCVKANGIRSEATKENQRHKEKYPDNPELYTDKIIKGKACSQVFVDTVVMDYQIQKDNNCIGVEGDVVVILVDDPDAYGIHLN